MLAPRGFLCILTCPSHLLARPSAPLSCISHSESSFLPDSFSPLEISDAAVSVLSLVLPLVLLFFWGGGLFILVAGGGSPQLEPTYTFALPPHLG